MDSLAVAELSIYRFAARLREPAPVAGETIRERNGLFVCVRSPDGHEGWGEISPLPGFSIESLDAAAQALARIRIALRGVTIPVNDVVSGVIPNLHDADAPASVLFGVELGLLNLLAAKQARPLADVLRPGRYQPVAINALISGEKKRAVQRATAAFDDGFRTIKIKVGNGNVDSDVQLVRAIRRAVPSVMIRADANRRWTLDEALTFCRGIEGSDIEYLEEPVRSPDLLENLSAKTNVNLAMDESLRTISVADLDRYSFLNALVCKPTLLGGISKCKSLADWCAQRNIKLVISSTYESGLGSYGLAAIASALGQIGVAHGLGTGIDFIDDPCPVPFKTINGNLDMSALTSQPPVPKSDHLRESDG